MAQFDPPFFLEASEIHMKEAGNTLYVNKGKILPRPDFKIQGPGLPLVVQWLRLSTLNAGGLGSIPDQGTRYHMPQLSICMLQLRVHTLQLKDSLCWHSQVL